MAFGKYLKWARAVSGLTAQELGNAINTTGQYITQMEQEKLKAPNKKMAYKIAKALDVNDTEMWGIAALERHAEWCRKEGIDPKNALTFFQAANFDKKKAHKKVSASL